MAVNQLSAKEISERVVRFLDEHREEILADSVRILQFRTVSGGTPEQQAEYERDIPLCLKWLAGRAAAMGFGWRVLPDDPSTNPKALTPRGVVGEISWEHPAGEKAPLVAIAAHIDVVTPVGNWTHPPFEGVIADGYLWGRGTQDDKGPLIQSLWGMYAARTVYEKAGQQYPSSVRLLIGTLEETGDWTDMTDYFKTERKPDFAYTPDADFPIINGEKGLVSINLDAEWPQTVPDETTGLEFISIRGGERGNIVPSMAEITLRFPAQHRTEVLKELVRSTTEYQVEHKGSNVTMQPNKDRDPSLPQQEAAVSFLGKAAHASTPHQGHNAILDLLEFIKDIETLPEPLRHFATLCHYAGSDLNGGNLGIDEEHPFIGPTTVCLSLIQVDQTKGRAVLNIRPTMGLSIHTVVDRARDLCAHFQERMGLKCSASKRGEGKEAIFLNHEDPKVAPYLKALQEGFEYVTGKKGELRATGGTTYSKAIPNCCAFGPMLTPEETEMAHQTDERMSVDGIIRNAKIYGASLASIGQRA